MTEYTKHYYAENQRIASKVGSGYESKDSIDRNDFFQIILYILDLQLFIILSDYQ
ncbi:MAG: hypothetical protein LBR36_02745 [Bacteroidales bacterium]|jgi:hypothetical protein|nr:hypothetical protein [Bacteroidales bacterium]